MVLVDSESTPIISVADPAARWHLYLIECRNGALYAGISNDVASRFRAHCAGRGARYTRANPPLRLVGSVAFANRASAARAEWTIKQLPRQRKVAQLVEWQHGRASGVE